MAQASGVMSLICQLVIEGRRLSAGGSWSPMFQIFAYNRFKILGLSAPYTKQVRDSYAPEKTNSDNCGMGTLIFTIDPDSH